MKINKLTSIESNPSNTLLETMEQAGLREPEYNCRDGHCGACRSRWIRSEIEVRWFCYGLHKAMKFLPCICKAKTDLSLEVT
ncbi:2Fe-2S iron-sulfur cluster-binding protein [Vibrio lentus]|nr:2Fe-2S iron-sulfur cluster-binding protein [Vibrio lentus]